MYHIEAFEKGGLCFNIIQTDEERNSIANLLFMCYRHHKETDEVIEYPVARLRKIKEDHELKFTEKGKEASSDMIRQILFEINYFWQRQKTKKFEIDDLKIKRDFDLSLNELFDELENHIKTLENYCDTIADSDDVLERDIQKFIALAKLDYNKVKEISYYENPFSGRNWEIHNIGRPNYFSYLNLCINELKVRVLEELHKCDPENIELKDQLDISRSNFEETYDNTYYVD